MQACLTDLRERHGTMTSPVRMQLMGVHITLRMRLECTIKRRGERQPSKTVEVLNEIVIDRGANPYLTKIECWEHDCLITKVRAPAPGASVVSCMLSCPSPPCWTGYCCRTPVEVLHSVGSP